MVVPARPTPTTQASALVSPARGPWEGTSADGIQMDILCAELFGVSVLWLISVS